MPDPNSERPEPKSREIEPDVCVELVRNKARELHLVRGGVNGRDLDDRLEAERVVRREKGLED